jgi:hypothetical protein
MLVLELAVSRAWHLVNNVIGIPELQSWTAFVLAGSELQIAYNFRFRLL